MASIRPRASSPTPTSYSGVSNYRSDTYRPTRDREGSTLSPPVPSSGRDGGKGNTSSESRAIAKLHWDEIGLFLGHPNEPPNSRISAREKLTRLTRQQFLELSTDVYDELMRRNSDRVEVPFLPVRDEFHPKRNQARQKLATLPVQRFKDLSGDVYYEIGRRYPEFKEPEVPQSPNTPASQYDEPSDSIPPNNYPPTPSLSIRRNTNTQPTTPQSQPEDLPTYGRRPTPPSKQHSQDEKTTPPPPGYGPGGRKQSIDINGPGGGYGGPTRKQSLDSQASQPYGRRPSVDGPGYGGSQASTATGGLIIPNKSTIAEEEIEVPYGREGSTSPTSSAAGMRTRSPSPGGGHQTRVSVASVSTTGRASKSANNTFDTSIGGGGLSALGNMNGAGSGRSEDEDYYDKISVGRASMESGRGGRGRQSLERDDLDKLRRDYEFKIATMQSKIGSLENEVSARSQDRDRITEMSGELKMLRERAEDQAATIRSLQRELNEARARAGDAEEVTRLRERVADLENDEAARGGYSDTASLQAEVQNLLDELKDVGLKNEEILAEKDSDYQTIQSLSKEVKEYKRKYEQAKTELRNFKATSSLLTSPAQKVNDDGLPVSDTGGILDVHMTAFQSSVDGLLAGARSNAPSSVLTQMKSVVNSVTAIIDDVRAYERTRNYRPEDEEQIRGLRERAEATLANLVSASKNHATSYGMSPVSLMDAAASHVAATIVELAKLVYLKRSSGSTLERAGSIGGNSLNGGNGVSGGGKGYVPGLRSVEERSNTERHNRTPSGGSDYPPRGNASQYSLSSPSSPPIPSNGRGHSRRTSNNRATVESPQSMMTAANVSSDMSGTRNEGGPAEGSDEAWEELKPYLEAQSESIVYFIQSLLSSIRAGAQGPELHENLTQIITIVSSIVAVCKDSFPTRAVRQGNDILQELSEQCNKLSEMQGQTEITKQARQVMASSSFGVAKAMKELMKL